VRLVAQVRGQALADQVRRLAVVAVELFRV
jgi:hypothetical protein